MLEQVQADLTAAMKSQEKVRLASLRMLKSALKNAEIEAGKLDDAAAMSVIMKLCKQRKESIEVFEKNNRQELADLHIKFQVAKFTNQRALDKRKAGQLPGPEMAIAKMALTQNLTQTAEFIARVLGPRLIADTGEWGTFSWAQFVLGTPGMRIAGGSDEVLRNIVGERVLGLPKDPGIDSKTPFRDLKVGTQAGD